uniref:Uncharacterized protein n=1 Tax=Anguilla anguilla TaxID=7936 RepID=A0A0E9SR87_ANGAN
MHCNNKPQIFSATPMVYR